MKHLQFALPALVTADLAEILVHCSPSGHAIHPANSFTGGPSVPNPLYGTIYGTEGYDVLFGSRGAEQIWGGAGDDTLYGGAESDTLGGGNGNNVLYGGDGADFVEAFGGADLLFGGAGNDVLMAGGGNDTLDGGAGADWMWGNLGDDVYIIDNVNDQVVEGISNPGIDTVRSSISYSVGDSYIEDVTLTGTGNINAVGASTANTLTGNGANNLLAGQDGNDTMYGGAGHDQLEGGTGTDWVAGGAGNDTLSGGAGADSFVFDRYGGLDHITDFTAGTDHLRIASALVTLLGGKTALTADAFYAAAGAVTGHDGDDRLIYNTSTGNLYYDADGSGTAAAVQIAVLDKVGGLVPVLAYSDFIFG